jgi:hypothetical protein
MFHGMSKLFTDLICRRKGTIGGAKESMYG